MMKIKFYNATLQDTNFMVSSKAIKQSPNVL